jgi:Tropinone reductase 1
MVVFQFLFLCLFFPVAANASSWVFNAGSTAVVTGGTKGIGLAIVEEFAALNCTTIVCARNEEDLSKLSSDMLAKYDGEERVFTFRADVSTKKGRGELTEFVRERFNGRLDILVNNVGTNIRKPTSEYDAEEVEFIMRTNFHSCFELSKSCYSMMKRRPNEMTSSIINIGSVAGDPGGCMWTGTPYSASKGAMNQLTGNLACEWGR